jgi:predicted acyl esterase
MRENVWRDEQEWPLARTRYAPYYLRSQGQANSLNGDGRLELAGPAEEPPDRFVYDPDDPVPTCGGNTLIIPMGMQDQRQVETRHDVLVYTNAAVPAPLQVTGPIVVKLFGSSSGVDTDFTAKLVDVRPDGYARNLAEGILRTRYRASRMRPAFLTPGQVYEVTIDSTRENRRQKSSTIASLRSSGQAIDDLLNGFVGAVVGGLEFAGGLVLGVGAVVEAAIGERAAQPFVEEENEPGNPGLRRGRL